MWGTWNYKLHCVLKIILLSEIQSILLYFNICRLFKKPMSLWLSLFGKELKFVSHQKNVAFILHVAMCIFFPSIDFRWIFPLEVFHFLYFLKIKTSVLIRSYPRMINTPSEAWMVFHSFVLLFFFSWSLTISQLYSLGSRVTEKILTFIEENHRDQFCTALRFIKLWARRRGIYGNVYGYLCGVNSAMLTAYIHKMVPMQTARFASLCLPLSSSSICAYLPPFFSQSHCGLILLLVLSV